MFSFIITEKSADEDGGGGCGTGTGGYDNQSVTSGEDAAHST